MRPLRLLAVLCLSLGLAASLAACGSLSRDTYSASDLAGPPPKGLAELRFNASDSDAAVRFAEPARRRAQAQRTFDVLALSGGGSNGAYGAGVLVGWTKRGERPEFDIVTGVSTGALTAPYAFLGPSWDNRLTEAYTGKAAGKILKARGLGVLFRPSVYSASGLRAVVDANVTDDMLRAIVAQHKRGRRLLIATTNLDTSGLDFAVDNRAALFRMGYDRAIAGWAWSLTDEPAEDAPEPALVAAPPASGGR